MRLLVFSLVILLGILLAYSISWGHSWYDSDCCSNTDCRPVACDELIEQNDGKIKYGAWTIEKPNVRPSKDSKCHICIPQTQIPRCAYIQQGS